MDESQHTMNNRAGLPPSHSPGSGALAADRLRRSAYLALQRVCCEFRAGVLTLRGRLPSYYLKQVAQMLVATVEGVEQIDNRIEVVPRAAPAVDNPGA
jgi:osmotically-inducible protein OsmY